MRPRKLRHRPSDELIDIRESVLYGDDRGLPWLFSVFVVLFLLLTILLFYFIFTTRDVYLSQKQAIEEADFKKKEAASLIKEESDEDDETWKELTRRKGIGKQEEKVHVDIVPIVNRKTGVPDKPSLFDLNTNATFVSVPSTTATTTTTEEPKTTTSTSTTTSTEEPITTTAPTTSSTSTTSTTTTTEEPTTTTTMPPTTSTTTSATTTTTSTTTTMTTEEPITVLITTEPIPTTTSDEYIDSDESTTTASQEQSDENTDILLELEDDLGDVQVEEYEETTTSPPTTTSTTISVVIKEEPVVTTTPKPIPERNYTRIIWDRRPVRSRSEKFSKFAIITHHEECSNIGKKIFEAGGNSIDATIASEFCISAVHPHSTGPGFGAVMLVHSKKKNGTFVIDGRERAPKNANQNTFVINPTNAHIGYSSMGVPGWISTLWTAYKQFGSGKIGWKMLIEPTLELLKSNRVRIDRILGQAFESRKNHVLHEKSFGGWLNQTTREGSFLRNPEYEDFLKQLKESIHAEHDFYGGHFSKNIVDEMKSRGGLISKQDLESYNCIVTRAETMEIEGNFLAGPHLPYHFPILGKVFKNITESFGTNPENILEYYVDFVKLLQKGNQMRAFVADDLFEPEVKQKIDDWIVPENFKPEEQAEQNAQKRKQVPFSRILSSDDEGNAVNFMSSNGVPWGSVRRSSTLGFVWNNAISSFDVFCRHEINCVRGGKRPSVTNGFPTILLDSEKQPQLLISPTLNSLETTAAIVIQSAVMNMLPHNSLDHPRIYPQSIDQVFVETGIPEQLYRTLWTDFRAQFTHPTSPVTLLYRDVENSKVESSCDYRQNTKICFPSGT